MNGNERGTEIGTQKNEDNNYLIVLNVLLRHFLAFIRLHFIGHTFVRRPCMCVFCFCFRVALYVNATFLPIDDKKPSDRNEHFVFSREERTKIKTLTIKHTRRY